METLKAALGHSLELSVWTTQGCLIDEVFGQVHKTCYYGSTKGKGKNVIHKRDLIEWLNNCKSFNGFDVHQYSGVPGSHPLDICRTLLVKSPVCRVSTHQHLTLTQGVNRSSINLQTRQQASQGVLSIHHDVSFLCDHVQLLLSSQSCRTFKYSLYQIVFQVDKYSEITAGHILVARGHWGEQTQEEGWTQHSILVMRPVSCQIHKI